MRSGAGIALQGPITQVGIPKKKQRGTRGDTTHAEVREECFLNRGRAHICLIVLHFPLIRSNIAAVRAVDRELNINVGSTLGGGRRGAAPPCTSLLSWGAPPPGPPKRRFAP